METKLEMIVLIDDRLALSVARDVISFAMTVALIGVGVLLDSGAMQWFGFVAAVIFTFARVSGAQKKHTMTAQAAADLLAEKYGVRAND